MSADTCVAEGCDRTATTRSMCPKHYKRWWRRCDRTVLRPSLKDVSAVDRALSLCVEDDGCWIYTGALDHYGYVRLHTEGRKKRLGHRIVWEHFNGPIPDGLTFDHLCRRPACINPWHGDLVPKSVNSQRANAARRGDAA